MVAFLRFRYSPTFRMSNVKAQISNEGALRAPI